MANLPGSRCLSGSGPQRTARDSSQQALVVAVDPHDPCRVMGTALVDDRLIGLADRHELRLPHGVALVVGQYALHRVVLAELHPTSLPLMSDRSAGRSWGTPPIARTEKNT